MRNKAFKNIRSRYIIFFFGLIVGINYYLAYWFYPALNSNKCFECFAKLKPVFLLVEITDFLFITFMALIVYGSRLCVSNVLSVGGLYALSITNILGMLTPIKYDFYHSIVLQIGLTAVLIISVLYLLKRKE